MPATPDGSARNRPFLYGLIALGVGAPAVALLLPRLSMNSREAGGSAVFADREEDRRSLASALRGSSPMPVGPRESRVRVLEYGQAGAIGLDELKKLLFRRKDDPLARAFVAEFQQDQSLMAEWEKAQKTGDTAAFLEALRDSAPFAALVAKYKSKPGFEGLALELARHEALRELVVDALAGRTGPGSGVRVVNRDRAVRGIAGSFGGGSSAFAGGGGGYAPQTGAARGARGDGRMAAAKLADAPDVGEGRRAFDASCAGVSIDRGLAGAVYTQAQRGMSFEAACANTDNPGGCVRMVHCCRQDPSCFSRSGGGGLPAAAPSSFGSTLARPAAPAAAAAPAPESGGAEQPAAPAPAARRAPPPPTSKPKGTGKAPPPDPEPDPVETEPAPDPAPAPAPRGGGGGGGGGDRGGKRVK